MLNLANILILNPSHLHFRNCLYASVPFKIAVLSQFKQLNLISKKKKKGDIGNVSDDLASH